MFTVRSTTCTLYFVCLDSFCNELTKYKANLTLEFRVDLMSEKDAEEIVEVNCSLKHYTYHCPDLKICCADGARGCKKCFW